MNLSSNADYQIAEALKTFGLSDSTKNVIVVKVASTEAEVVVSFDNLNNVQVSEHVRKIVQGREIEFNDTNIQSLTNMTKLRKFYKLGPTNGKRKTEEEQSRWEDPTECTKVILGIIALRGSS